MPFTLPTPELLERFVHILDDANDGEPPPKLVRLEVVGDEIEFGMKPIEDCSISAALLGFTAPEEWVALGVMAGGWAGPIDDTYLRPSAHPEGQRMRSVVLVGRDGSTAGVTHFADGHTIDGAPPEGAVMDCLLRAMGLPTPPPAEPTSTLFAAMWLGSISVATRGRKAGWAALARLHPALELLTDNGERAQAGRLPEYARALANVCPWGFVRQQATDGRWPAPDLTPDDAAWMDDGAFARWVLGAYPPLPVMLDDLRTRLQPSTFRRLRRTVEELTGYHESMRAVG